MEKISLPVIEPKTHHLSGLETADDISHLMTNLDSFLAETSLLNTLPNTQAQIDEIVKWLHERQLTATIDCLIEEFYSKEVKPEVIVQTFPFNKLDASVAREASLLSVRAHSKFNWVAASDSRKNLIVLSKEGQVLTPPLSERDNNPFKGSIIASDFHPTLNLLLIGTMCESHALLQLNDLADEVQIDVLKTWKLHDKYVVRVKWSPLGNLFATASHDKTVGIYQFDQITLEATFVKQLYFGGAVEAIQFTLDGKKLIVATRDDSNLHYVNLEDWSKILVSMNELRDNHVSFTPLELSLSPDGKSLLVATDNSMAILFRVGTPYQIRRFFGFKNAGLSQPRATFDNKNFLYITSEDNSIYVFDLEKEKHVSLLTGHKGIVRDVTFDVASDQLVSVSYDKSVKFWKREY